MSLLQIERTIHPGLEIRKIVLAGISITNHYRKISKSYRVSVSRGWFVLGRAGHCLIKYEGGREKNVSVKEKHPYRKGWLFSHVIQVVRFVDLSF